MRHYLSWKNKTKLKRRYFFETSLMEISWGARRGSCLPGPERNSPTRNKERPPHDTTRLKFVLSLRSKVPEQIRSRGNTYVAVILGPSFPSALCEFDFRTVSASQKKKSNLRLVYGDMLNQTNHHKIWQIQCRIFCTSPRLVSVSSRSHDRHRLAMHEMHSDCRENIKIYVPNIASMKKLRSNLCYGTDHQKGILTICIQSSHLISSNKPTAWTSKKASVMPNPED